MIHPQEQSACRWIRATNGEDDWRTREGLRLWRFCFGGWFGTKPYKLVFDAAMAAIDTFRPGTRTGSFAP